MRMVKNEEFLRKDKVIGIIKIENMLSGRIFLVKSTDVVKDYSKIRFSLDLGTFENSSLEEDYTKTGLELFDIALDAEADDEKSLDALLEERKKHYSFLRKDFYL